MNYIGPISPTQFEWDDAKSEGRLFVVVYTPRQSDYFCPKS